MQTPLSLSIGLRYTRARHQGFVSFISWVSMLGIALGVGVLITVLSVMNGFDHEIEQQVLANVRHISVYTRTGVMAQAHTVAARVGKIEGIASVTPFIEAHALLTYAGREAVAVLQASDPNLARTAITPQPARPPNPHRPSHFSLTMSDSLAIQLGLSVGDKLLVTVPRPASSLTGLMPSMKRFKVSKILSDADMSGGSEQVVNLSLNDAQCLLKMPGQVTGLAVYLHQPHQARLIAQKIQAQLGSVFQTLDWTAQLGDLFKALKLEKNMMFLILALIVLVAAFNLVSGLVMLVNDKQAEIAILKTMGATPGLICRIFMVQGLYVGGLGTFVGVLLGIGLALNITHVVHMLERLLHMKFMTESVYFGIDHLPSIVRWTDIGWITAMAAGMTLMATLYPAWRAAHVQPAEVLRHE